jgi:hypothetical protein
VNLHCKNYCQRSCMRRAGSPLSKLTKYLCRHDSYILLVAVAFLTQVIRELYSVRRYSFASLYSPEALLRLLRHPIRITLSIVCHKYAEHFIRLLSPRYQSQLHQLACPPSIYLCLRWGMPNSNGYQRLCIRRGPIRRAW